MADIPQIFKALWCIFVHSFSRKKRKTISSLPLYQIGLLKPGSVHRGIRPCPRGGRGDHLRGGHPLSPIHRGPQHHTAHGHTGAIPAGQVLNSFGFELQNAINKDLAISKVGDECTVIYTPLPF